MKTSLAAVAAALTFAASSPALADDMDDRADGDGRPTIIVTADGLANGARQLAATTPGGTNVVSHEDYADKSLVSLRDALSFTPGIYLQPRFGQEVRISIRGSGLSRGYHMRGLTLLQDGVPINLADDNGDFQELDPAFFDHLQIYRGANALRLGSGTLGGAINGVTPTGDKAPGGYARLDAGSFSTFRGLVSAGFGDQAANAWVAASADTGQGDRDHAKRSSMRFHGNSAFQLSDSISTRFYASVNHIKQELPGALTLETVGTEPKTGNFAGDQQRNIDSLRLQNRTTLRLGDSATLDAGVFLNAKQLYHPIYQVVDQTSTDRGVFARLDWASGIFAATLGGESRWGDTHSRRFRNLNGKRGALTFDAQQQARTSSIYGELRAEVIPGFTLIAGGIYADGHRRQDQVFPTSVTGKARYESFSPKFALLWQPDPRVQFFANYSRSAEFPGFVELAQVSDFVPLKEQSAWTAEIGLRGDVDWISWDISIYRADLKGEMLQYNIGPDVSPLTFNADRTLHKGMEAGLTLHPIDWLRIRQTWLYSNFRLVNDAQFGDSHLPVVPRHVLRTEVRFGAAGLHVAPSLEWVPQGAWADYSNTRRVPGYALLGLTGGATVANGVDLFMDLRNITGKKAVGDISAVIAATDASAIYYPVERRAFSAGVRARF